MLEWLASLMIMVPTGAASTPPAVAHRSTALLQEIGDVSQATKSIDIVFTGLRSGEGKIAVAIFDSREASKFPSAEKALRHLVFDNTSHDGQLTVHVDDLPVGDYAFAVFHDEDANGSFKFGMFGIPREGIAFSNNPRIYFGPPSFEKARVNIGTTDVLRMEMKYF